MTHGVTTGADGTVVVKVVVVVVDVVIAVVGGI
jgi:hypothetical protein